MNGHSDESIELFTYAASPFGAKVFWALQYKGVDFSLTHVNPFTNRQIEFSKQKVIPVLQINDSWIQDSRENCILLDKLYPDKPFAGTDDEERKAIIGADRWVAENMVSLHFRTLLDRRDFEATKRNNQRLANCVLDTIDDAPAWPWLRPFWVSIWHVMMRFAGFVRHGASRLDESKTIGELHKDVVKDFELRIEDTGFIAGTAQPSFADMAAFSILSLTTSYGCEGAMVRSSSPKVQSYYDRMLTFFPSTPSPALYGIWPPAALHNRT